MHEGGSSRRGATGARLLVVGSSRHVVERSVVVGSNHAVDTRGCSRWVADPRVETRPRGRTHRGRTHRAGLEPVPWRPYAWSPYFIAAGDTRSIGFEAEIIIQEADQWIDRIRRDRVGTNPKIYHLRTRDEAQAYAERQEADDYDY